MAKHQKMTRITDSARNGEGKKMAKEIRKKHGKRFWTSGENAKLIALYPHQSSKEVAALLGRRLSQVYQHADQLGLKKTAEYLASPDACRMRRGDKVGLSYRYPKGHVPANKGLRRPGWSPGRMAETQFKKGERRGTAAQNWVPVGTIQPDSEGYLRKKICEGVGGHGNTKAWAFIHKMIWIEANGAIPEGHIVRFRDGNKANCVLENLMLLSRRENMALNTVHRLPKELAELIQLKGALNRQIRKREKHGEEQDGRFTQSSL